jgi:hypothetical protein
MYYLINSGVINYKVHIKSVSIYLFTRYLLKIQKVMGLHQLFFVRSNRIYKIRRLRFFGPPLDTGMW